MLFLTLTQHILTWWIKQNQHTHLLCGFTLREAKALHPHTLVSTFSFSSSSRQLTRAWEGENTHFSISDTHNVMLITWSSSWSEVAGSVSSPAPSAWAGRPGSSAQSWQTPTLCLVGLWVTWPRREALVSSGCTLQGAAEPGRSHPGHRTPGSAPATLWEGCYSWLPALIRCFFCVSIWFVCVWYLLLPAQTRVSPCQWRLWPPGKTRTGRWSQWLCACCSLAVVTADPASAPTGWRTLDGQAHTCYRATCTELWCWGQSCSRTCVGHGPGLLRERAGVERGQRAQEALGSHAVHAVLAHALLP